QYKNKYAGTFGDFGILSFNGNKIITTSGGGMVIGSKDNIKQARFLSTQAQDDAPHYEHSKIGYNYRMSNIVAGIGRGQLKTLNQRVERKKEIFNYYQNELKQLPGVQFQPELPNTYSNRWLSTLTIDPRLSGTNREKIRKRFVAEDIDTRPLWKPMHLQPVFKDAIKYENGVSEKLFNDGLCLPSGTAMTEDDLDRVVKIFKSNF
ncbi:MAG: DegT/DnrJ/EryC1/StrS family aminotransferase, partial [Calditrichaceae bacterium]